jgi:hypothetical protein
MSTHTAVALQNVEQPSRKWQLRHILLWILLAGLALWWKGPSYIRAFEPQYFPPGHWFFLPDFFQEWASARNRFNGLSIYTPHEVTIERYLGLRPNPNDPYFIELNAHPPTAVLLGIPFAALEFVDAFALWNVLSLAFLAVSGWLIVDQLDIPFSPWSLLPAITLLLLCHPFWHQMVHGQLNLLLLLLITGVWVADRRGHPRWAGTLLGLATAIKFTPGFLFVYFVLRREWSAVRAGLLALAAISVLTALILGPEAYRSYFLDVLPRTSQSRSDWHNLSLSGVWCKLFESSKQLPPVEVQPLAQAPALALLGMTCTLLGVLAILVAAAPRFRATGDWDLAFALTTIGMLLVSPITWDHYLLLLALPVAVLWQRLPRGGMGREVLLLLLAVLWVQPGMVMEHVLILLDASHPPNASGYWIATPLETLTALSVPCYVLVALFVLTIRAAARDRRTAPAAPAGLAAA